MTELDTIYQILGDFWYFHREDELVADFVSFNDIGLPTAYLVASKIVNRTDESDFYVSQTWEMLLDALDIEDTGFESLQDLMTSEE